MKTRLQTRGTSRGIMLMETLAYMVVLVMVLGAGSALLYRAWSNNIGVRRNADEIVRALNAGELWRADIRSATGPIVSRDEHELHIPGPRGETVYEFANGFVSRKATGQQPRILAQVVSSHMQPEKRNQVSGWKWEIELNHNRKEVQFRPFFTFEAIAANEVKK